MRKLTALVLLIAVIMACVPALAETDATDTVDVTGEWALKSFYDSDSGSFLSGLADMGYDVTIVFDDDNVAHLISETPVEEYNAEMVGYWIERDSGYVCTFSRDDGSWTTFELIFVNENELTGNWDGVEVTFNRKGANASSNTDYFNFGNIVDATSVADFKGEWHLYALDMNGIQMIVESLMEENNYNIDLSINEQTAVMEAVANNIEGTVKMDCSFNEGTLVLSSYGVTVYTCELYEDGTLKAAADEEAVAEMYGEGQYMTYYFRRDEAE